MTTDQDNQRVSNTYRELGHESTPAELDERILAMAARESRSRYGLARAWVRPVAWAATIGLSLAFVLELTWFADVPVDNGPPRPTMSGETARQESEVIKAKQEDVRRPAIAERVDTSNLSVPASPAPGESSQPAGDAEPALEDASLLRGAEQRARLQAVSVRDGAAAPDADAQDRDPACAREARASAETWYDCILALREQGLDDTAAAELEALQRAFPDFREPQAE